MLPKKVGIVIPSCGFPCLIQCLTRMAEVTSDNIDVEIVISMNPPDRDLADNSWRDALKMAQMINLNRAKPITFKRIDFDGPIGFGAAVNAGISFLRSEHDDIDFYIIANDDLLVTRGWITGMWFPTKSKMVNTQNRIHMGRPPVALAELYKDTKFKGIGLVGPISDGSSGNQLGGDKRGIAELGLDEYARQFRVHNAGTVQATEYLSGFCVALIPEALEDLLVEEDGGSWLFDERFKVGGFEDNDLCQRARSKGWGLIVAADTFIGHAMHQTLNHLAPESFRGMRNLVHYMLKYEKKTKADKKVIAVMRVAFKCANDLAQYYSAIRRASLFVDGFAVLLTNDPLEISQSYDKNLVPQLPEPCVKYIRNLMASTHSQNPDRIEEEDYSDNAAKLLGELTRATLVDERAMNIDVKTEYWHGEFNERDERNRTHAMADEMGADWCISIDADEVIEDRISPRLFKRFVSHPNPDRICANTGWINHWETMSLVRVDRPFAHGLIRMSGPRIWKADYTRIISGNKIGLHCGNAPFISSYCSMESSLRFRHLSHVRQIDRVAKTQFYNKVDTDKRVELIGGSDYSHISKAERVEVSMYNPANGIGGFCLMYEDEPSTFYGAQLDRYYTICDRIVTVWTGEWDEKDKAWTEYDMLEIFPTEEEWRNYYPTGPCWEVAQYSRLFDVEWVHKKLDPEGGLAACRNAGIDKLRSENDGTINWCFFWDCDEFPDPSAPVKNPCAVMRGMAEVNDTWGFMTQFANPTKESKSGKTPTPVSDAMRFFKMDKDGIMKFNGRVHETLDESLKFLMRNGIHPNIQQSGMRFVNVGLTGDGEQMRAKLKKYQNLLIEDIKEDPLRSAPWLALGLQLLNDQDTERARLCMERSCLTAGSAYLPFKELALMDLRNALGLLVEARKRVGDSFPWAKVADTMIEFLMEYSPPLPLIDTGTQDVSSEISLPPFPYDSISLEDGELHASVSQVQEEPSDDSKSP